MSFLTNLWDFLNLPVDQAVDKMYHSKSKQWIAQFAPPETAPKLATAARMTLKPDVHYLEFPERDSRALASRLHELRGDRARVRSIAKAGAEAVRNRNSLDVVVGAKLKTMGLVR